MTPRPERGDVSGRTPSDEAVELRQKYDKLVAAYESLLHEKEPPTYQVWTLAQKALNLAHAVLDAAFPSGEQPGGEDKWTGLDVATFVAAIEVEARRRAISDVAERMDVLALTAPKERTWESIYKEIRQSLAEPRERFGEQGEES